MAIWEGVCSLMLWDCVPWLLRDWWMFLCGLSQSAAYFMEVSERGESEEYMVPMTSKLSPSITSLWKTMFSS